MYAAGIGTGYHMADLGGYIKGGVVINATSGDKFYKDSYTKAQDIGFGVIDPAREGKNNNSTFNYKGTILYPYEVTVVKDVTEIKNALTNGENVVLNTDVAAEAGSIKVSGTILNGNGNDLNVTTIKSTDAAISVIGGTIKDLDVVHANTSTMGVGIGISPNSSDKLVSDLIIEKVTVSKTDDIFDRKIMYAIYAETGNSEVDVVISDSALYGAIDVPGAKTFTATNTTFGSGEYWFMALSGESTFTNCTFESTYCILAYNTAAGKTLTFNNCNVAGTQLTADNFKSLLVNNAWDYSSDMCSTNLKDCVIIIDGVQVNWN
jgi:hypothetical protein